jgi:hypothetical protein
MASLGRSSCWFAELATSFDKDRFIAEMTSGDSEPGQLTNVRAASVDGVPATHYKSAKGSEIYVAASAAPVILRIAEPSSRGGTLTFSDYGKPYPFAPPPAAQTVDFSTLEDVH